MLADRSLTPKEAIRLAALGTLALSPLPYADLATAIRHFIDRVIGPSAEIMGHSIELLRYEGLVERVDPAGAGDGNDVDEVAAPLRLTAAGRAELQTLLTANVRPAGTALNKLVIALKFRFLHLLDPGERVAQMDMLAEVWTQELARLDDLRAHHAGDPGFLTAWLDNDTAEVESRLAWLDTLRRGLPGG